MLNVGLLRNRHSLKESVEGRFSKYYNVLFRMGAHYGLRWIWFTPKDISFENNTVNGTFLENDEYVKQTFEIPKIIDNNPVKGLDYDKFEEMGIYMLRKRGGGYNKIKTYELLKEGGKFSEILIPTQTVETLDDIVTSIDNYKSIVVKPTSGTAGKGLRKISRLDDKFIIILDAKQYRYSYDELTRWYERHILTRNFIIQPFINSVTKNGDPFDIRVQCNKGKGGKYVFKPYARIGDPKGFVANLATGGYGVPIDVFLRTNYDDAETREFINNKLFELGTQFPDYYASFATKDIFDMSLDMGVTTQEDSPSEPVRFWLYEVNALGLGNSFTGYEEAVGHSQYIVHLAEKLGLK